MFHTVNGKSGFSLIELVLVVIIMAIIVLIAMPSYQRYSERKDLSVAQQHALRVSTYLERYKARNFSYFAFDLAEYYPNQMMNRNQLLLPIGVGLENAKFILTLVDYESKQPLNIALDQSSEMTAGQRRGLAWAIKVERVKDSNGQVKQARNYDLLLTSTGIRCMTTTANMVASFRSCGSETQQSW